MKNKASELLGWLQDAASDCAQGDLYPSKDWIKIENKADEIYNDPATCRDLLGDRIFDACNSKEYKSDEWKKKAKELCDHLISMGHGAVQVAMKGFIKDHELSETLATASDK